MALQTFSFGDALSHFTKTEGPGGFVWKYALTYAVASILLAALGYFIMGPAMFLMNMDPDYAATLDQGYIVRMVAYYAISVVGGILIWVMLESAAQRRYQHGEGFSLRLGGDEGRVFVVGLLWLLTIIGIYIAGLVVIGGLSFVLVQAMGQSAMWLIALLSLVYVGFVIWLLVRLSPASAMTVRDRKIHFFGAFRATKNRFWPLFFAFFVMMLIALAVIFLIYMVIGGVMVGVLLSSSAASSGAADPAALIEAFLNPVGLVAVTLMGLAVYFVFGVIQFAFVGIPALAAKTDPSWSGAGSVVNDTFA